MGLAYDDRPAAQRRAPATDVVVVANVLRAFRARGATTAVDGRR
jgi:hypothetical protein